MTREALEDILDANDPVGSLLQVVLKYEATPNDHAAGRAACADRAKPVAPGAVLLSGAIGAHGGIRGA